MLFAQLRELFESELRYWLVLERPVTLNQNGSGRSGSRLGFCDSQEGKHQYNKKDCYQINT